MGLFDTFKRPRPRKKARRRPTKTAPPPAPSATAEDADGAGSEASAAADEAIQTLKELEELVVVSGAALEPAPKPKRGLAALLDRAARDVPSPTDSATTASAVPAVELASPRRDDLIRDALAVRRRKQEALRDLSPEQRELLRAMATKLLMGRGPGG